MNRVEFTLGWVPWDFLFVQVIMQHSACWDYMSMYCRWTCYIHVHGHVTGTRHVERPSSWWCAENSAYAEASKYSNRKIILYGTSRAGAGAVLLLNPLHWGICLPLLAHAWCATARSHCAAQDLVWTVGGNLGPFFIFFVKSSGLKCSPSWRS